MDRARIVLADDHKDLLASVAAMLDPEFDVVDVVDDGEALVESACKHDPDVVVLDITMPNLNGMEAARRLMESGSRAKIVFLTVHQNEELVRAALDLGANGYVVKSRLPSDLAPALRAALAGRLFVSEI
jgi:DNA-binding NarL/FixJ family response regulator